MQELAEKPIFIMQRKKPVMVFLYYLLFIIWNLTMTFLCIVLISLDDVIPKIMGYIGLIFFPFGFFAMFDVKEVICYENYLLVKKKFFYNKVLL